MDDELVFNLNQAAIDGIRSAGATSQLIFVEGNSWTGAWTWVGSSFRFSSPTYYVHPFPSRARLAVQWKPPHDITLVRRQICS